MEGWSTEALEEARIICLIVITQLERTAMNERKVRSCPRFIQLRVGSRVPPRTPFYLTTNRKFIVVTTSLLYTKFPVRDLFGEKSVQRCLQQPSELAGA
jgi:hypothetical protein